MLQLISGFYQNRCASITIVSRLDPDPFVLAVKKKKKSKDENSSWKVDKPISKSILLFFFVRLGRKPLYQLLSVETSSMMI